MVFDILLPWYQYQPYLSRTGIGSLECPPVISRFYWLLRIWDILRILKIFFDVLFINSKKRVKHTHKNIKIWRVLWIHAMFSFSFIYTEGILWKEKSSRFSSQMQGKKHLFIVETHTLRRTLCIMESDRFFYDWKTFQSK